MRIFFIASALVAIVWTQQALAVPDTVSARVTDVTTSTFSMVWMTDVAADPGIEVYADAAMTTPVTDGITVLRCRTCPRTWLWLPRRTGS